jgi:hypothetical protein
VYDDAPVAHSGSSEKIANAIAGIDAGVPHMNVGLGATHSRVFVDASDVTPYRMRMWYDSIQMTCPVSKVPSLLDRDVRSLHGHGWWKKQHAAKCCRALANYSLNGV